ncbi:MAG: signal transduction histidine kinase [Cellvibrionaceae bacterium]|jgi:signal transduction histidine kinase
MNRHKYPSQWNNKWHELSPAEQRRWRRRGMRMFIRLMVAFGLIVSLIFLGMGGLALLFTRWVGGEDAHIALFVWVGGLLSLLMLPAVAIFLSFRAYRNIAKPLSEVINAAESVSQGDLSVRVGTTQKGQFDGLTKAFNHMVSELETADQRRRNLTADVAHELRTPLHIIQGNLEGILDDVYEPSAEHIEATLDETRILARLVEDLRILSLAEAGQLQLTKETVDVAELLTDVVTSFSGQAAVAEIKLTHDAPVGLSVSADYDRLTQVINNLVSNSLRHTAGDGTINLTASQQKEYVVLTVADTGEGIPAEQLPYIFDRFWRGDQSRQHSGSTGLGLAIAQQLILAHNGELSVESQEGIGTTFIIQLFNS